MGKKQHQSDKLYITQKEWSTIYGGRKASQAEASGSEFRRLPFDSCALTFQPFTHPVLVPVSGAVYDLVAIMPFIAKYGADPASGTKIKPSDLVRLHYSKNADGKYHCPVTFKVFNEHSHIVAITTTGNVYSWEAVEKFNIQPKHFKDLLTDEPFARKDIVTLQDPMKPELSNLAHFHHIKNNLKVEDADGGKSNIRGNATTASVLEELKETEAEWKKQELSAEQDSKFFAAAKDEEHKAHYSTGKVSASFTSTGADRHTKNTAAAIEDDVIRYKKITKKGYVRIVTNMGELNVELHCDLTPKTCENFIKHCKSGYYKETEFHRSIKHFMIQGGDPTGTGRGGEAALDGGKPFKDEFRPQLTHSGRGILSMANSGPATNKSQFFITYRSCPHLNNKHTVFGQVVGGQETLSKMEAVPTDDKDRPQQSIKIIDTEVFVDPYADAEAAVKEAESKKEAAVQEEERAKPLPVYREGVGKYLKKTTADDDTALPQADPAKKKPKTGGGFGNFSGW